MDNLNNIALIILNYNSVELTIKAAEHLLGFKTGLNLVIVDNCSKDDSQDRLREAFSDNNLVHLVFNNTNYGYAHGNNVGIACAERLGNIDIVGIMNPDVIVDTHTIKDLCDMLQKDESLGFVTVETIYNSNYFTPNECAWKLPTFCQLLNFCTILGYVCRHFLVKLGFKFNFQTYYPIDYYEGKDLAYVDVVQGCFFMGKLQTFIDIGKLDENTFLYYEENILGVKIRKVGKRNAVLTNYYIQHNHRVKDASLVKRSNKIFDMTCLYNSRDYFIREYFYANVIVKLFLRSFLRFDFYLRKLVVGLTFKD